MQWLPEIRNSKPNTEILFVGTDINKREEFRNKQLDVIEKEKAKEVIEDGFNCKYMECCAKNGQGIREIYQ